MDVERTRYATKFYNEEYDLTLWRSGKWLGRAVIPRGQKPVEDDEIAYEPVFTVSNGRTASGDETVLETAEEYD